MAFGRYFFLLFAAATPAACSAATANPLIGDWQVEPGGDVDSEGFHYCTAIPRFTFTATSETSYPPDRPVNAEKMIYLVSGSDIYVSSTPGFVDAPKFTMLGPNEMTLDALGHCKYRRR